MKKFPSKCLMKQYIYSFQAENVQVHPLYFMIPITICSSFSFMLPIATGPNAMVFKSGKMDMKDMVRFSFSTHSNVLFQI